MLSCRSDVSGVSRLERVLRQPCGPKAGIEHGGRGFRAGQTGLSAARHGRGR